MGTEIYYFSGTGNSLFAARRLAELIPGSILKPVAGMLREREIRTAAEGVGIVFPCHGLISPIPVRRFLERADIGSADYIFAVVTRSGSKFLGFPKIEKIIEARGKRLDARFLLNMPDSDPKLKSYTVPTEEKIAELEREAVRRLDGIAGTVTKREASLAEDTEYLYPSGFLLERLVLLGMWYAERSGVRNYFYHDESCAGCGTCEQVCPSGKVTVAGGRPTWRDDVECFLCYACLNYCPSRSVQISDKWYMKSYTDVNGRYPHPYATAGDIAAQKSVAPV